MGFEFEEISNEDYVFRQVTPFDRIFGDKRRRFPNETHFELRPGEKGLSTNWDKHISLGQNFILIGLTHNPNTGKFLNHTMFQIFRYPVSFLMSIEGIENVKHQPVFHDNPAPVGKPNNKSHSEVIYENDEEIWLKLSDFCNDNYDEAFCDFKANSVNDEIEELRELLNNTEYHKLWDFK